MATLYIMEQGAYLHKRGGRLVVEKAGNELNWVHAFKVDQVVLMGNIQIGTPTIAFLLKEGIDTVFLSMYGKYRGRLISQFGKNVQLRQQQFRRFDEPAFVLDISKRYVEGKLANVRTLLRRANYELKDERIAGSIHGVRQMLERVNTATTLDSLRGIEGKAAVYYFSGFQSAVRNPEMRFDGRSRRPPRDEVNALLSFGYTLLGNIIQTLVYQVGFDPYLGCLHEVHRGRPSLVLDLLEEFRPVIVDSLVLRLVNRKVLTPKDFVYQKEAEVPPDGVEREDLTESDYPVLMTHQGRKKFITQFEGRLSERVFHEPTEKRLTYRDICLEQVRLLVRHLNGEAEYLSYRSR